MIKSFEHKGLAAFFETGSKAGIRPDHAAKLSRQLARLDESRSAQDMNCLAGDCIRCMAISTGTFALRSTAIGG